MQIWKQWIPSEDIYDLLIAKSDYFSDKKVILGFENKKNSKFINIIFEGFLSLRESDEFSYEKSFADLALYFKKNKPIDARPWFLFVIENSEYIQSFRKETLGLFDEVNIKHYVIIADDVISEVLSPSAPKIEVTNKV